MIVTRPALSEPELVEIAQIGTLEAFNTDGLRSLLVTMRQVPNMAEKTLRYPGHIDLVRALRESGFLSQEPITAGGSQVRPIDVTAALLFQQWRLGRGEPEFTAMEISVRGQEDGTPREYVPALGSHRRAHRHVVDGTHHGLHLHGRGSAGAGRPVRPGRHLPARVRGRGRDLFRARAGRSGSARCASRTQYALRIARVAVVTARLSSGLGGAVTTAHQILAVNTYSAGQGFSLEVEQSQQDLPQQAYEKR